MLKFTKPTLVTITAPTASGKNYLRDGLENKFGWKRIISTTTREQRGGEVDGEDYHFISAQRSLDLEAQGEFAELVQFRNVRYGVKKTEMDRKMNGIEPPMVILEPQGLELYKVICNQMGWDMFKIYVNTTEGTRLTRLTDRTSIDIGKATNEVYDPFAPGDVGLRVDFRALIKIKALMATHLDRVLSITGDERTWLQTNTWDAIVPGDDFDKAVYQIEQGVKWRNHRVEQPIPYTHNVV